MSLPKIYCIFTFLLSLPLFSIGQNPYFKIQNRDVTKHFAFPIFQHPESKQVEQHINYLLQLNELQLLIGQEDSSIFEKVSFDDGSIYGGKVSFDYRIYSNNANFLSIQCLENTCGLVCASWVNYYTFNSQNGDVIQLKDLFTEKGFESFKALAEIKRNKQCASEINEKGGSIINELTYLSSYLQKDKFSDFCLMDSCIWIDGENSIDKNHKYLKLDLLTPFNLHTFYSYLNKNGKQFFSNTAKKKQTFHSFELPQLFYGYLSDTLPIVMTLNADTDENVHGVYSFIQKGKGIYLDGYLKNEDLTLKENNQDYKLNGVFHTTFIQQTIEGNRINYDKSKSTPVFLKRQFIE
jgi:hypothetical protein